MSRSLRTVPTGLALARLAVSAVTLPVVTLSLLGCRSPPPQPAPVAAAPVVAPDTASVDAGRSPGEEAEEAVRSYVRLLGRGDLAAVREYLGAPMLAELDRMVSAQGATAVQQAMQRNVYVTTLGPGRPAADGSYHVAASGAGGRLRVDYQVRQDGGRMRLFAMRPELPPGEARSPAR